jgi:Holliday junction resolvase RusA-like endonuclease
VVLTIDEPYMRCIRDFKIGVEKLRGSFPADYPFRASAFLLSVWVVLPDRNDHEWDLGRADLDHFTSAIMNGLRGVAWADDSRIFEIHAQKRHVEDDEKPNAKIQITSLDRKKKPAE